MRVEEFDLEIRIKALHSVALTRYKMRELGLNNANCWGVMIDKDSSITDEQLFKMCVQITQYEDNCAGDYENNNEEGELR